jgi:hypothetical protein
MLITATHSEGKLTINCYVNGGILEEDVLNLSLDPGDSITVSDRFSTCSEIASAESAGQITVTSYETDDFSDVNREKVEAIARTVTTNVNVTNSSLDVALQDQTTPSVNLPFVRILGTANLASTVSIDDISFDLVAGHGFSANESICIRENTRHYHAEVTNVASNTITVDTPIDYAFTTAAYVCRSDHELADADGSSTPLYYEVNMNGLDSTVSWDITRIVIHMEGGAAMDDSLFGDQSALTNGIVLRFKDTTYKNIFNAKSNGSLLDFCNSGTYDDRAGGKGVYGFRAIKVFGGQENQGVVIRLLASTNDAMQVIVQDDLTGLTHIHVTAIGHYVDP